MCVRAGVESSILRFRNSTVALANMPSRGSTCRVRPMHRFTSQCFTQNGISGQIFFIHRSTDGNRFTVSLGYRDTAGFVGSMLANKGFRPGAFGGALLGITFRVFTTFTNPPIHANIASLEAGVAAAVADVDSDDSNLEWQRSVTGNDAIQSTSLREGRTAHAHIDKHRCLTFREILHRPVAAAAVFVSRVISIEILYSPSARRKKDFERLCVLPLHPASPIGSDVRLTTS